MKMAAMSANTPIYYPVGGGAAKEGDSFMASVQASSNAALAMASDYQDKIVDYCIEWERVVTSRGDEGIKETKKLHERLMHYDNKVEDLRRKVNDKEDSGKAVSVKLKEKLGRNELKLKSAWSAHESSASMLCNLLEQVTQEGWKDLAPLVLKCIRWEAERASEICDTFATLPVVAETLMMTMDTASSALVGGEEHSVPSPLADDQSELGFQTTGWYNSNIYEPTESPMTPVPENQEFRFPKSTMAMPLSPDHVGDFEKGV